MGSRLLVLVGCFAACGTPPSHGRVDERPQPVPTTRPEPAVVEPIAPAPIAPDPSVPPMPSVEPLATSAATSNAKVVLDWQAGQGMWGNEQLLVREDGHASYQFEPVQGSGRTPKSGTTTVTPDELAAIKQALVHNKFCGLRSSRLGVPDEARPTLTSKLAGVSCTVTLWDGEWRDTPRAAAVIAAIKPVFERLGAKPP